jgi:hypothetical protein
MMSRTKSVTYFIFLLIAMLANGNVIASDSTLSENHSVVADNSYSNDVVDEDPSFSLFLLIIILGFISTLIGIGVALTVLALLILFALISFGVVSVSIMIGLAKKSVQKGFESMVLIGSSLFGLGLGMITFTLANKLLHWVEFYMAIGVGALIGLIGGFLLGIVSISIIQRLAGLLKQKLEQ